MISLEQLRAALGGDVVSGQVLCPGPRHSQKDRSLAVKPVPGGFVVFSHSGDDWKDCHDYVRERLGLPAWRPGDEQYRRVPPRHLRAFDLAVIEAEECRPYTAGEMKRIARAVAIWNEGVDPRNTPARTYLNQARKLDLPSDLAGRVLRFHPKCPWRDENTGQTVFIPVLLAAFTSFDTGAVTAIHRIRVDQPYRWPKADRMMLGSLLRAAVLLDPLGDTLAIGEGVETCMAGRQLGFAPVWALGSVGRIAKFPVFDGVTTLRVLGEAGAASAQAIEHCSPRWHRAGRAVRTIMPDDGCDDLNTELMRRQQAVPA
jgi:hypothetical protein